MHKLRAEMVHTEMQIQNPDSIISWAKRSFGFWRTSFQPDSLFRVLFQLVALFSPQVLCLRSEPENCTSDTMAIGKNKRRPKKGNKKRIVDPFTRKDWYDVKAPGIFKVTEVGKTFVNQTQGKGASSSLCT